MDISLPRENFHHKMPSLLFKAMEIECAIVKPALLFLRARGMAGIFLTDKEKITIIPNVRDVMEGSEGRESISKIMVSRLCYLFRNNPVRDHPVVPGVGAKFRR